MLKIKRVNAAANSLSGRGLQHTWPMTPFGRRSSATGVISFNRQAKRRLIPPWKWAAFNGYRAHDGRRTKRLPLLSATWHVFYVILPIGLSSGITATLRLQRTQDGYNQ